MGARFLQRTALHKAEAMGDKGTVPLSLYLSSSLLAQDHVGSKKTSTLMSSSSPY